MTYDEIIDTAVRDAARSGLSVSQLVFPLLNLTATTLANAVEHNNLDPEDELELVRHKLDELYTMYLDAYRRQTA